MESRAPQPMPPLREPTAHVYYGMTRGLCATCGEPVDAKIRVRDGAMHFAKFCSTHGHAEVEVASSAAWYLDALTFLSPSRPPAHRRPVVRGCPRDCGPCELHQQKTLRALVEPGEDAEAVIEALRREDDGVIVTSAEPARSLQMPLAVAVTRSTSAEDLAPHFAGLCSEPGRTTLELVPHHAGAARVTIPDMQALLATVAGLEPEDFVPSPHAHPHCFSLAVLEPEGDGFVPLVRRLGRAAVFELVGKPPGAMDPAFKTVVLHALMDAEDFDTARVMRCPIAYVRLGPDARLETTPLCARRATQTFGAPA